MRTAIWQHQVVRPAEPSAIIERALAPQANRIRMTFSDATFSSTTRMVDISRAMATLTLPPAHFHPRHSCPACGGSEQRPLAKRTGFSVAERFPSGLARLPAEILRVRRLVGCVACGLWYYTHIPDVKAVIELLDDPSAMHLRELESSRQSFGRALAAIDRLAPRRGRVLEIGPGRNGLLSKLPHSWGRFAVEPVPAAADKVDADHVYTGPLEELDLPQQYFSSIVALDVFEHFQEPALAMQKAAGALEPGGILLIETGTTDAFMARLFRSGWYYLNHLEHFQAFNARALQLLCERHSLAILELSRVTHTTVSVRLRMRSLVAVTSFGVLTAAGRYSGVWQLVSGRLGRADARPPSSIAIERDHVFLVAAKLP